MACRLSRREASGWMRLDDEMDGRSHVPGSRVSIRLIGGITGTIQARGPHSTEPESKRRPLAPGAPTSEPWPSCADELAEPAAHFASIFRLRHAAHGHRPRSSLWLSPCRRRSERATLIQSRDVRRSAILAVLPESASTRWAFRLPACPDRLAGLQSSSLEVWTRNPAPGRLDATARPPNSFANITNHATFPELARQLPRSRIVARCNLQ